MTAALVREVKRLYKAGGLSKEGVAELLGLKDLKPKANWEQLELDFTDVDALIDTWMKERGVKR